MFSCRQFLRWVRSSWCCTKFISVGSFPEHRAVAKATAKTPQSEFPYCTCTCLNWSWISFFSLNSMAVICSFVREETELLGMLSKTRHPRYIVRPDSLASEKRSFLILEIEPADSDRVMDLSNSDAHTSKCIPWLARRFMRAEGNAARWFTLAVPPPFPPSSLL